MLEDMPPDYDGSVIMPSRVETESAYQASAGLHTLMPRLPKEALMAVSAAESVVCGGWVLLLVDSGAFGHVCPQSLHHLCT